MVEVYTTNIRDRRQADELLQTLQAAYADLKLSVDLDTTEQPYPCGHSILRVEGANVPADQILAHVRDIGFLCDVLEDKICDL